MVGYEESCQETRRMMIDAYCEWLFSQNNSRGVVALPDGLTEEKYLDHLDVLIKNLFSQLTVYPESDYRSGKAALILLKKYCFDKRIYENAPLDSAFSDYSDLTQKMIQEELDKLSLEKDAPSKVNEETLFTIMYNTFQLLTSVIKHHEMEKDERYSKQSPKVVGIEIPLIKVDVQKKITWERENTGIRNPIRFLDEIFMITETFEKSKSNENAPRKISGQWAEYKYLSMIMDLSLITIRELGVQ